MRNMVKRTAAGAVLGGSLLFTGGLGIATAIPASEINDQLVNLAIGNGNVLRDVNVEVASQIAGLLCGAGPNVTGNAATGPNANGPTASGMSANETTVNVSEITAQARQVDAGQMSTTTCNSSQGVVTISQNSPANSPNGAESPGRPSGNSTPSPAPGSASAPAPAS